MKKLAIHGKEDIRWESADAPVPDEGEIRLRVRFVGICGSDLHYYFHGANGEYTIREPLTPGHEFSAVVDLDPSGDLAPGTPVTVHPARFGPETPGLEEHPHLRPGGDYLGSAATIPHRQGAAAEFLVVERHMVRVLPDALPLQRATLAEPLAVAMHAVGLAGNLNGKRVLVIGTGPIGLLLIAAALRAGAESIAASDIREEPLARATSLGASDTFRVGIDDIENEAFDVIFECSGVPASLTQAVRAAKRAGTIVQVGMLPDAEIQVNLAATLAKELTFRGAFRFAAEIDEAIALLASSDTLDAVITHVVSATDAVHAFTTARDSAASAKVLISL